MCDEIESQIPEPEDPFIPREATGDWKESLREQFESWLEDADEIPEVDESVDAPDLYSLYEELAALRNEARKGNRKSAEVFSQLGESLGQFDAEMKRVREQLSRFEATRAEKAQIPRAQCLALVEILDRMHRLQRALERQPRARSFGFLKPDGEWKEAWGNLSQGFSIVTMHLEKLLEQAEVRPVTTLGEVFDPVTMVAVATAPSPNGAPNTVVEELSAGYRWRDEVLRPAEVKISKPVSLS